MATTKLDRSWIGLPGGRKGGFLFFSVKKQVMCLGILLQIHLVGIFVFFDILSSFFSLCAKTRFGGVPEISCWSFNFWDRFRVWFLGVFFDFDFLTRFPGRQRASCCLSTQKAVWGGMMGWLPAASGQRSSLLWNYGSVKEPVQKGFTIWGDTKKTYYIYTYIINCICIYLEPKCPLFWLEKTFF